VTSRTRHVTARAVSASKSSEARNVPLRLGPECRFLARHAPSVASQAARWLYSPTRHARTPCAGNLGSCSHRSAWHAIAPRKAGTVGRFPWRFARKGTEKVHVWNTSRRKHLIPCQFRRRQNERRSAKLDRLRSSECQIIAGRNVPAALGQTATSWPGTRAQCRRGHPDRCVSPPLPNGAPGGLAAHSFPRPLAAMSKVPFQFSGTAWQGRVDSGEFTCKRWHSFPFTPHW
jgi:hypothetical protein